MFQVLWSSKEEFKRYHLILWGINPIDQQVSPEPPNFFLAIDIEKNTHKKLSFDETVFKVIEQITKLTVIIETI